MNECECFDGFEGIKCDRKITKSIITTALPEISTKVFTTPDTNTVTPNNYVQNKKVTKNPVTPTTNIPKTLITVAPKITDNLNLFTTTLLPLNISSATVISNSTFLTPYANSIPISPLNVTTTVIPTTLKPTKLSTIIVNTFNSITTATVPSTITTAKIITKCPYFDYCKKVAKNGFCDLRCNIEECNLDSGDCIDNNIPVDKNDEIDKIVEKCPEMCIHQLGNGLSTRKTTNLEGVEVYFDVDFSQCKSGEVKCRFQNAKDVESYINTAPVYEVTSELGAPIYEARVIYPEEKSNNEIGYIFVIFLCSFAGVVISSVGVLEVRKRKNTFSYPQYEDSQDSNKRRRYETFDDLYKMMRTGKSSEVHLLETLKRIYNSQRSLDWKTERNETLLHWAIRFNTLIGVNLTPLKLCAESDDLLPFLQLLCAHESINIRSVGFVKSRKCWRQNVLHHAAGHGSVEAIKYLLKLDSKKLKTGFIRVLDENGRTPLVYAIESKQWEAAKVLIKNMIKVDLETGISALVVAKKCGNDEIYQLINSKIPKVNTPPPPPAPKKDKNETPSFLDYLGLPSTPSTTTMMPPPQH
uniref:EGF-like domain-containing protein n=1 Tax=Panagrolaimus sp. ES5 TaxID=591445 RepID=A0AC34FHI8_9BILA